MQFQPGDRVRMLKHADWTEDATATVIGLAPDPEMRHDGAADLLYHIEFDHRQRDAADEENGLDLLHASATVAGRYLRKIGRTE